ncbi:hypothetical protein WN66_04126 [Saccharomyces cerevisiae]|uniref:Putative uncharacterized protein YLL047W n=1 Tax=Saccharomyces cerevisiae (strain ATCC 204508 / S288c) TaxID=559292 RepID=YL047_YEAST|nr:RecName: Full=Putative uncharacterized protein YLL047W [Saccharomyces cerevisiae S288C]AAT93363.1 YLL047W [Saccharomyces cerevisiae]KZV09203.1 hypothetical protein WN66_04126 [Saccharomyces cerevisiae]WNV72649.1 hypothetical protein O6U65_1506 [Saccharomyces cerevisiae synthetic construct]CAA97498.1 unnamed protein product [Saccharomyces cerevisiae]
MMRSQSKYTSYFFFLILFYFCIISSFLFLFIFLGRGYLNQQYSTITCLPTFKFSTFLLNTISSPQVVKLDEGFAGVKLVGKENFVCSQIHQFSSYKVYIFRVNTKDFGKVFICRFHGNVFHIESICG